MHDAHHFLVNLALVLCVAAVTTTLFQDLRGLTGATVLAVVREGGEVVAPTGKETLRVGDLLALAGTREAIENAEILLGIAPPTEEGKS